LTIAGWTLFAFAGVLRWTTVPLIAGAILLAIVERPRIFKSPDTLLDAALVAWLFAVALTLVPLPARTRAALAPGTDVVDAQLFLTPASPAGDAPERPLSVDPPATEWALALGAALVLLFWSARAVASSHGLRATARGIAWMGLALAVIALVQHGTAPALLYWWIRPVGRQPTPFGPFVSRNDIATWLIMAMPVAAGYAVARVRSRRRGDGGPVDIESTLDATELWLAGSVFFMASTLITTTSRSGLMGALAAVAGFLWLARRRMHREAIGWLAAIVAVIVAIAATYASWHALASRVEETMTVGLGGRREIWERTWAMARDFRLTGVGVGAYERAMSVYQARPHVFYFNHAHNEYLQLLSEGGILLAVPAAIAATAAAWQIWRRIDADHSSVFWIRIGAASGMLAAAVQSVWDTGLRMPANAVLFALLAAIALHVKAHDGAAMNR